MFDDDDTPPLDFGPDGQDADPWDDPEDRAHRGQQELDRWRMAGVL